MSFWIVPNTIVMIKLCLHRGNFYFIKKKKDLEKGKGSYFILTINLLPQRFVLTRSPFRKWHHILLVGTVGTTIAFLNICHSDLPISWGRNGCWGESRAMEKWRSEFVSLGKVTEEQQLVLEMMVLLFSLW